MSGDTKPTTRGDLKEGYKTTEFWLSLAAMLFGFVVASGVIPDTGIWAQVAGVVTGIFSALGYSTARGFTKAATAKAIAIEAVNKEVAKNS